MNQGKGRKKYVCGIAGILIVSLIAFYVVLNGTENNQTSQVKNEIYTLEREGFEMTEEEAAKAVFDYMYSDCDYDYDAKVISTMLQGQMVYFDIVNIGLHFILKNVRPYAASCSEA